MIYVVYFVFSLLGMFSHFLKKNIKGETGTEIKNYFKTHTRSTVLALLSVIFGFIGLIASGAIDDSNIWSGLLTSSMLGYTFDSILNKWDSDDR